MWVTARGAVLPSGNMAAIDESRLHSAVQGWVAKSTSLCIFIFGKTGVGKSSLINTLLGKKIAEEGESIHSQTRVVTPYAEKRSIKTLHVTVENVKVTLWDSPGLKDPDTDEEQTLRDIQENCRDVDVFVYCTSLTQTRIGQDEFDSIANLTRVLGDDIWKRGLIALTFANEVRPPPFSKEDVKEYFQVRVSDWREAMRFAVMKAGVSKVDADSIPVVPTGYRNLPLPGDTKDDWFSEFWIKCLQRTRLLSLPAILKIKKHDLRVNHARIIAERLMKIGDELDGAVRREALMNEIYMEMVQNPTYFSTLLINVIRSEDSQRLNYTYYVCGTVVVVVILSVAIAYVATRRHSK